MTHSIATWEFRHGDTILPVLDGNVTIDEINVPAVSGTFVIPDTPGLVDQLDPRTGTPPRIQISGRRTFWDSLTVAEFSAKISQGWYPNLVPDWSWESLTVPYNVGGPVTVGVTSTIVHTGDQAYTLTVDASPTEAILFGRPIGTVTPGEWIGFSAYRYVETDAGFVRLRLVWTDDEGAVIGSGSAPWFTSGAEWREIFTWGQVPAGAAGGLVLIEVSGSDTASTAPIAGGVIHTDSWTAVRAPTAVEAQARLHAATFPGPGYPLVSDLTTAWAGWTVADVTHYAADPLNFGVTTGGPSAVDPDDWPSQEMLLSLHVRDVDRDRGRDTLAVTVASDEALLTDWSPITQGQVDEINALIPGGGSPPIGSVVNAVMAQALGSSVTPSVYQDDLLPEDIEMGFGMSAWDMVRTALDMAGDKLRPLPENGGLIIERPFNNITGNGWFFSEEYLTDVTETITRSGDWYDSALLISQDANGQEIVIGYAAGATHTRTYRESFPQGYPISTWQAENIVARSKHRGRRVHLVGPITMGVWIGDLAGYRAHPDDPSAGGDWQVSSITYDLRSDTMSLTLRPDPANPPD